jgi:hypothetical protein
MSYNKLCIKVVDIVVTFHFQIKFLFQLLAESYMIFAQHYAYNADCQKDYDHFRQDNTVRLNDNIMCTADNVCPTLGVSIQKMMSVNNHQIPFVFGVYFQKRNCLTTDVRLPYLYTRLAPYVDWIEKVVDS